MVLAGRTIPAGYTTAQTEVIGALLAPECGMQAVAVETLESGVNLSVSNSHGVTPEETVSHCWITTPNNGGLSGLIGLFIAGCKFHTMN